MRLNVLTRLYPAVLFRSPVGLAGAAILLFWLAVAAFAPWIAPFSPTRSFMPVAPMMAAAPGGGRFWLGTDLLGRDLLSRLVWGTRSVVVYAPLATASAYVIGIALGLWAGYRRGVTDMLLSRTADLVLAFPVVPLYIVLLSKLGSSGFNIVFAITLSTTPGVMRIMRGLTLDLREQAYVAAARLRGEGTLAILFLEILPNARATLIADACMRLGYVVTAIGTLGFLGMGLPPPTPDWGGMIEEGRVLAILFPHLVLPPCLAIVSLALGCSMLADGLRRGEGR
nr:ABC transporter permease [Gluconacetobacter tumulisoli]